MAEKKPSALELLAQVMAQMQMSAPAREKPDRATPDIQTIYIPPPAGK